MIERTHTHSDPGFRSSQSFTPLFRLCRFCLMLMILCLAAGLGLPGEASAGQADAPVKKSGTVQRKAVPSKKAPSSSKKSSSAASIKSSSQSRNKSRTKKTAQKSRKPLYVRSLMPQDERAALLERGIYSGFGPRAVSKRHVRMHKGIDVCAPQGSVITAFNDGKVLFSGRKGDGYGIRVLVEQLDGRLALYAHMKATSVKVGDEVRRGDHLGFVGRTGRATGCHLHFELIDDGTPLNPADHVWLGSELVLSPDDPDPMRTDGRTSFAATDGAVHVQ